MILEQILYEFPVARMEYFIPKWTGNAPARSSDEGRKIIQSARTLLGGYAKS